MREYFNLCESDFLASRIVRGAKKIILDDKKATLSLMERDDESVYFVSTDERIIENERAIDSLVELTAMAIKKIFRRFAIKKDDLIMVVGVGNDCFVADSLGVKSVEQITPILTEKTRLCALCPSVSGRTGIESFDIVKSLVERLRPKAVVCIDTLSTNSATRLSKVIQIRDGGLTPGIGVGNQKTAFDRSTLGTLVVGIGVPLIIHAKNLLSDYFELVTQRIDLSKLDCAVGDLIVASKEVDLYVEAYSKIIGKAINKVASGKN